MIKYCENLHFFTPPKPIFCLKCNISKLALSSHSLYRIRRQFTIERVQHYTYYIFKINIYMCKLIVL